MKAVFLHIYYAHLYDELIVRLKNINFQFNLYINLVEGHTEHLKGNFLQEFPNAKINISPNQGMDCGGQLRTFNYWLTAGEKEEYLIFIHSKGKPLTEIAEKIRETDELRDLMISIISPSKTSSIEEAFNDQNVGMVGVKEWHRYPGLAHGDPIPECEYYCDKLGLNNYETNRFGFIGGTMFWVRSSIFKKVFGNVDIVKIVEELPPSSNGGLIHGLERIFGYIVLSENYQIKGI